MNQSFKFNESDNMDGLKLHQPKPVAEITLCGCITLTITDTYKSFIKPTPEQIQNLHDMLCIDVHVLDEDSSHDHEYNDDCVNNLYRDSRSHELFKNPACLNCPINPANGGSGNCNCTLANIATFT